MKILIAGAGEVGTHLAKLLSTENHDIVLLDNDHKRLEFAHDDNFDIMPVLGNPTSMKLSPWRVPERPNSSSVSPPRRV